MRQDIHVHLDLSVPTRTLVLLMTAALLVTVTPELGSENVTLSTYYPAPSGVYSKMITTQDTFLATTGGKVGVGTTSPKATLDVGETSGNGTLETVLARLSDSNATGDGTFLGVKGWSPSLALSFSLEHHYGGITNSAIKFFGGSSNTHNGGYLTFTTNADNERMRIAANGSVGIGTTDPTGTASNGSTTPNVGIHLAGGTGHNGYLYIDNTNTHCQYASPAPSPNSNIYCGTASDYYVTWTPGLYVEGWTRQDRGEEVGIVIGGHHTSSVWAQDSQSPYAWQTGVLQAATNGHVGAVWCCAK
ncbi:MAG: hypothetical protein NTY77_18345 [Elusimicrobia bacterium]|nr:hypothetical protein [Elusimicrobiota bacterium]